MTAIATGIFKQLVAKKQSGLGVKATAGSAQLFRRVTSSLDMKKATYKSNEIRPSQQRSDFRHGVRSVDGAINGELSVGTYQGFMESVCRAAASALVTSTALTNVTAASTSGAAGTFTRAAGSFLTDGFLAGHVVNWSGWATTGVPNNAHNFLITSVTALVMTGVMLDGVAVGAKASGDSVTCVTTKFIKIPLTSHTKDYWTIEHNFSDIVQAEQFKDCVIKSMGVKLPASGMATVDFGVMGLDMDTSTSAYFTTPTGASAGANLAAVNGALYVGGVAVAYITSMSFSVEGNHSVQGGVVGSNVDPDIFPGAMDVTGSMSVLFVDATMRDLFKNETEAAVIAVFTTANTPTAGYQSHVFPRVKFGGASKDDGEKGLTMTMPFTALENPSVAGTVTSTYMVQDSAFV